MKLAPSKPLLELRPYQHAALEAITRGFESYQRQLAVKPTGSWALAISVSCAILTIALPIDRWVNDYLTRRLTRFRELEKRIAALEKLAGAPPGERG